MKYSAMVIKFFCCLLLLAGIMCANAQESAEPVVYNKSQVSSANLGLTLHLGVSANYYQSCSFAALKNRLGCRSMKCWF
jgi:hypothetical protein